MQPTNTDDQTVQHSEDSSVVSAVPPIGNDSYTTDSTDAAPAVSSAMNDALAATAAASASNADDNSPMTPVDNPIFGPTPASTALANDPLANNSSAPAVPSPTTEQSINSSVDTLLSEPAPASPSTDYNDSNPSFTPLADPPTASIVDEPIESALPTPTGPTDQNSLLGLKQQALQQLSPLVGHLDQSPEEKFKTTMMMLQATDDSSLVQAAYESAQAIPDEKARAQAILDVVNEINYFTHQQTSPDQPPVFDN